MSFDGSQLRQNGPTGDAVDRRQQASACCGGADHATAREIEILVAVCAGLSNSDIGRQLFLSEGTTRVYLTRWYRRVGARNRAELVARAFHAGLIDASSWPPRETGRRCVAPPNPARADRRAS